MQRIKVELKNGAEVRRRLARLGAAGKKAVASALYREGWEIMTESKGSWVPVDTGVLRSSGDVSIPDLKHDGSIVVELGYGGAACRYAIPQHERLDYHHTVGRAKYLELPAINHAPNIAKGVARDLRTAFVKNAKK
jgi:hypothetical protein